MMREKELPDFFTFEGKIFYFLSKNRYVGVSTIKIAEEFKMTMLETLQILVSLCEKGLVTMMQEGKTIEEDVWDIAIDLRRKDPDIEKIVNATSNLDKELNTRLKELKELEESKELQRIKKIYDSEESNDSDESEE